MRRSKLFWRNFIILKLSEITRVILIIIPFVVLCFIIIRSECLRKVLMKIGMILLIIMAIMAVVGIFIIFFIDMFKLIEHWIINNIEKAKEYTSKKRKVKFWSN